jgi:phosphonate transport system substrate-binding protein
MKKRARTIVLVLACSMIVGCKREPASEGPRYATHQTSPSGTLYRLAVHPLHNPTKLMQLYEPLVDYLNRQLQGGRIEL